MATLELYGVGGLYITSLERNPYTFIHTRFAIKVLNSKEMIARLQNMSLSKASLDRTLATITSTKLQLFDNRHVYYEDAMTTTRSTILAAKVIRATWIKPIHFSCSAM